MADVLSLLRSRLLPAVQGTAKQRQESLHSRRYVGLQRPFISLHPQHPHVEGAGRIPSTWRMPVPSIWAGNQLWCRSVLPGREIARTHLILAG